LGDEPAKIYQNLTTGGDRAFETLKELRRVAPREVATLGRTYLEGMLDKATAEGGFRRAEGVIRDWQKLGPETKRLMFGAQLTGDLDDFFLAAKKLAPAEGSATAGRIAAFAPYALAGEVITALTVGGPGAAVKAAAAGIGAAYVMPNVMARLLFTPGGAKLLTEAVKLPVGSAAWRQAMRAVNARAILAQKQEREDRGEKPAMAQPATSPPRASLSPGRDYRQALTAAAERHQLPPAVLHTVARIESSGRPGARSPKGATGLMQLMPATARQYGVRDIRNPLENIEGSARLLSHLWRKYQRNLPLVLAAYNAGEGAVDRYGGIPPFPETREYVRRAMAR
jgi:soluble lytic murein transglycosylase-like protein